MRRSRAVLLWLHRWTGLALSPLFLLLGLTGSLIVFADELDLLLNPGFLTVEARGATQAPLSPDALAASVHAQRPEIEVWRIFLQREEGRSQRVSTRPRKADGKRSEAMDLFLDPYDGRILAERHWRKPKLDRAHVIPFLFRLHYALLLPERWGIWLIGGLGLVWMLDCIVALWLTLPARPLRQPLHWRKSWLLRWHSGGYRRIFDLHRASGLWLWPVLFLLAFSGAYINLRSEVFLPVITSVATVTPSPIQQTAPRRPAPHAGVIGFDAVLVQAQQALPAHAAAFVPRFAALLPQGFYRVGYQESYWRDHAFRFREEVIYLDAASGHLLGRSGYDEGTAADKLMAWQYPLHSGDLFGLPGRILVCLAGIVTVLLSLTGMAIWLRKRNSARRVVKRGRHADSNGLYS